MAYARWGKDSDVYVFEHVAGHYECCGCLIVPEDEDGESYFKCNTPELMWNHLVEHTLRGDRVPQHAFDRLEGEFNG